LIEADSTLLARVKDVGCRIMASATTVAEALWLETRGVDIIIAQGYEAGGHRGTFLAQSLNSASSSEIEQGECGRPGPRKFPLHASVRLCCTVRKSMRESKVGSILPILVD
jgi:hypothetical protein